MEVATKYQARRDRTCTRKSKRIAKSEQPTRHRRTQDWRLNVNCVWNRCMPGKTEAIAADLRVSAKTRLENCRVPCETEAIAGDPRVSAKTMLKSAAACLAKQRVSRVSHISIGRRRRTRIPRLSMPANTRHGGSFHTGQDAASRASALSTREPGASESGACCTQQPDARMQRSLLAGGAACKQQFQPRNMRRWLQGPCSA